MDYIAVILQTLLAGAQEGLKDTCTDAVKDAYGRLKQVIKKCFDRARKSSEGEVLLNGLEDSPEDWQPAAENLFRKLDIHKDSEVLATVRILSDLLRRGAQQTGSLNGHFEASPGGMQIGSVGDMSVTHHYHPGQNPGEREAEGSQEFALPPSLALTEEETDSVLWAAIQPDVKYPICAHPAVTHASGAALVGLVTSAVAREIGILRDRFNTCGRQMIIESDPGSRRLEEFRLELAGLKRDLVRVVQKGYLGVASEGMLVGEVFKMVRAGSAVMEDAAGVLLDMMPVERGVNALRVKKGCDNAAKIRIRKRLCRHGNEIQMLSDRLARAADSIGELSKTVERDWAKDLDVVWDQWCRPKPRQVRQCRHGE